MSHLRLRSRPIVRGAGIHVASMGLTAAGWDVRRLARLAGTGRVIVLNLHAVAPATSRFDPALAPEVFEAMLTWLKRHCELRTLGDLESEPWPDDRPVAILSFDDGYGDFLEYAMPILDRHGVRVNQNVIPACVESGMPPPNVHLLDVLDAVPAGRLDALRLPGLDAPALARADPIRLGVLAAAHVKACSRAEREERLRRLREALPELAGPPLRRMLSAGEVAECARSHEIGVHSYEHDSMGHESDEHFEEDLRRCREWFGERLGRAPTIYAFPNGSYREAQVRRARGEGIEHVLLVGERAAAREGGVHHRVTTFGRAPADMRFRIARACR